MRRPDGSVGQCSPRQSHIADALNRDDIPTPQGGATWRPSSVRAAALAAV